MRMEERRGVELGSLFLCSHAVYSLPLGSSPPLSASFEIHRRAQRKTSLGLGFFVLSLSLGLYLTSFFLQQVCAHFLRLSFIRLLAPSRTSRVRELGKNSKERLLKQGAKLTSKRCGETHYRMNHCAF